ncbi:Transmembrane protein 110 [Termitomyces sp. J132]|nr:Transmembrane protein 110 [Termitomyces sp. J132]
MSATTSTSRLSDSVPLDESCQLLGPTALAVQAALGVFVLLSLVYKRHREPIKRPWAIWVFDVSKQVAGQMFVHGANVLASDIISDYTSGNACVFYFLHILLDTTLGVGIIYLILHALTNIITRKLKWEGFESGVYGTPPSFKYWARQAAVYVLALTTMKIVVIIIIVTVPGIFDVGEWLLSWTRIGSGDYVQVIFVMGIFPIVMNVLQFWLIDSIVKASTKTLALEDGIDATPHDREPLFNASNDDDDGDDNYRHHDIEHARPRPRSRSPIAPNRKRSTDSTIPEERKSHTASLDNPADHSYPPSLSNSHSSIASQPKPAKKLLNNAKQRVAPAPLDVNHDHPRVMPGVKVNVDGADDAWTESWGEQDDWADRVGEEDWTGRRLEHKKNALRGVWDRNTSVQVGS